MAIFFTSDTHYSHANILNLGDGRPFKDINHHDEMLIKNWNEVVSPDDVVIHLGDVALGRFEDSIKKVARLNGYKVLVPGNHDRISSVNKPKYRERFLPAYQEVFQEILPEVYLLPIDGLPVLLSHYPYRGDSQEKDRHVDLRPVDEGLPLIHGHIHSPRAENGRMFHVGVDAHNYYPVHIDTIKEWLKTL